MKKKIAALVLVIAMTLGVPAASTTTTTKSAAQALSKMDEARAYEPSELRSRQFLEMMERASKQCKNNLDKGEEAQNIGNMIIYTREKLVNLDISVSYYDLMDLVSSALGDGKKGWDCASLLAMYVVLRTPEKGSTGMTHITAYKVIQSARDMGMIGPT